MSLGIVRKDLYDYYTFLVEKWLYENQTKELESKEEFYVMPALIGEKLNMHRHTADRRIHRLVLEGVLIPQKTDRYFKFGDVCPRKFVLEMKEDDVLQYIPYLARPTADDINRRFEANVKPNHCLP
jgi:hypothetical protein